MARTMLSARTLLLAGLSVLACAFLLALTTPVASASSVDAYYSSYYANREATRLIMDEFEADNTEEFSSSSSSSSGPSDGSTGDVKESSSGNNNGGGDNLPSSSTSNGGGGDQQSSGQGGNQQSSGQGGAGSSTSNGGGDNTSSGGQQQSSTGTSASSSTGNTDDNPTGPEPNDGVPEVLPLVGFTCSGSIASYGANVTAVSSALQTEIAKGCGVKRTRVMMIAVEANANGQTNVLFTIAAAGFGGLSAANGARKFKARKATSAEPFTTPILSTVIYSTIELATSRDQVKSLPQVSFTLNLDFSTATNGNPEEFAALVQNLLADSLGVRADRIVVVGVKSGSVVVDFLVSPPVDPSVDKPTSDIVSDFVAQANNPDSPFRKSDLGSQVDPASIKQTTPGAELQVDDGSSKSTTDIGPLSRGGFIALIFFMSLLFVVLIGAGAYLYLAGKKAGLNQYHGEQGAELSREKPLILDDVHHAQDVALDVREDAPPETDRPVHYAIKHGDAPSPQVVRLHTEAESGSAIDALTQPKRYAN